MFSVTGNVMIALPSSAPGSPRLVPPVLARRQPTDGLFSAHVVGYFAKHRGLSTGPVVHVLLMPELEHHQREDLVQVTSRSFEMMVDDPRDLPRIQIATPCDSILAQ